MDVQPTFRYGFEGETRFLRYHTDEGVTQTNYLMGVHVGIRPQRLRPYAKFLWVQPESRRHLAMPRGPSLPLCPAAAWTTCSAIAGR